jgi:hypothetical protein
VKWCSGLLRPNPRNYPKAPRKKRSSYDLGTSVSIVAGLVPPEWELRLLKRCIWTSREVHRFTKYNLSFPYSGGIHGGHGSMPVACPGPQGALPNVIPVRMFCLG